MMPNEEYVEEVLTPKKQVIIRTMPNDDLGEWEVYLNDTLLKTFIDKQESLDFAKVAYMSFETGYTNGLVVAYQDKDYAREALEQRGITFKRREDFI